MAEGMRKQSRTSQSPPSEGTRESVTAMSDVAKFPQPQRQEGVSIAGPGGRRGSDVAGASALVPALEVSSWAFLEPETLEASRQNGKNALGLIETRGFLPLVVATDACLKAANVSLVRYDKVLGGMAAICVVGDIGAARVAVDAGVAAASQVGEVVASVVLANPAREVMAFFLAEQPRTADAAEPSVPNALGFIETKGMVTAVCALDIMMKSAKVAFVGYENPGSGAVTAIVRGELAAVRHAVATAAAGAQRVGQVIGSYVLTKLQRDLEGPFFLRAEGRRPALTSSARRLTIPEQTA